MDNKEARNIEREKITKELFNKIYTQEELNEIQGQLYKAMFNIINKEKK